MQLTKSLYISRDEPQFAASKHFPKKTVNAYCPGITTVEGFRNAMLGIVIPVTTVFIAATSEI